MRREFDAGQAAISQEMQVQRDETALIKEDYQILNERFNNGGLDWLLEQARASTIS